MRIAIALAGMGLLFCATHERSARFSRTRPAATETHATLVHSRTREPDCERRMIAGVAGDRASSPAPVTIPGTEAAEADGDLTCPNRKLETMMVELGLESANPDDIIGFLRDFTGLNTLLDAAVRECANLERSFPFYASGRLKEVLAYLCCLLELEFTLTEDKVILLTWPCGRERPPQPPRDLVALVEQPIR